MKLAVVDWVIIAVYMVGSFALGMAFTKRANESREGFFLAGRKLPWFLVGTSIVATTLSADTPLAVTELVRKGGLSGAWYGWSAALGIVTATIFFSKLWRRSGVITDAEFIELRYDGPSAKWLRVGRAAYLAFIVNSLILGWVILAMVKILHELVGVNEFIALPVVLVVAVAYATASGLWGVVATDTMQFFVAMFGLIWLTVATMDAAGGPVHVAEVLRARGNYVNFVPPQDSATLPFATFCIYLGMQWWAQRNADGGEYIGQRLLSAKSVKDAQLGMVWYAFAEFALKLWPLILTALASLVLMPDATDHQSVYPALIAKYLPTGVKGLMVASLLAAFMSTVDTHLNWGASYMVNDLYVRLFRPTVSDAQYLRVSRIAMVFTALLGAATSLALTSVAGAWQLLLALGSGQGLVVLLRWYWWRINAWSEISAMVSSAVVTVAMFFWFPGDGDYALRLMIIVAASTATWIAVTMLTAPVSMTQLKIFYARVRPRGGAWGPVRAEVGDGHGGGWGRDVFAWLLGLAFVYGLTLGIGKLILGEYLVGGLLAAVGTASLPALLFVLRDDEEEARDAVTVAEPDPVSGVGHP